MQNDYKRLACAFDKSSVVNFHEVESRANTQDSSATDWHDQSQPLYGMPIDTYPRQPLPPISIFLWGDLEQKFHDHFFSIDYELDLVDLVALR
jgi:hypothetical protein